MYARLYVCMPIGCTSSFAVCHFCSTHIAQSSCIVAICCCRCCPVRKHTLYVIQFQLSINTFRVAHKQPLLYIFHFVCHSTPYACHMRWLLSLFYCIVDGWHLKFKCINAYEFIFSCYRKAAIPLEGHSKAFEFLRNVSNATMFVDFLLQYCSLAYCVPSLCEFNYE